MSEPIFRADRGRFHPTEQARGPWDPQALHGGAPAALIAAAFEHHEPAPGLQVARLGFELLRPVPFAPLSVEVEMVRPGRRVQELAASLHAHGERGRELICRASALRLQTIGAEVPGAPAGEPMPGPEEGMSVRFSLNDPTEEASFGASAMEMRWLDDPRRLGPSRVWMRLSHPLVDHEPPSPLARLVATADFANGVGAALAFDRFVFINADLQVHLHRAPEGEWIGIDARTLLNPGGTGLAESVLHDSRGPVGRGFQALIVESR